MPETVCVKHGDASYCWNFETMQIEIITREPIGAKDCPAEVVHGLMVLISEKASETK